MSKLDHMGRETVRKLMDLPAAAAQAGVALDLGPELHHIEKVCLLQGARVFCHHHHESCIGPVARS